MATVVNVKHRIDQKRNHRLTALDGASYTGTIRDVPLTYQRLNWYQLQARRDYIF